MWWSNKSHVPSHLKTIDLVCPWPQGTASTLILNCVLCGPQLSTSWESLLAPLITAYHRARDVRMYKIENVFINLLLAIPTGFNPLTKVILCCYVYAE